MAPKKRLPSPPLEKPEDKVSDEEEEDSSEEEGSSSEQRSSSSEGENENPPPSTPISNPKPASESENESGTDSGSGSESETDAEPEPTPPPNPKVKPLASKPMKARSGTKRAAENGNDSNRLKKKTTSAVTAGSGSDDESETDEDVKLTGEDSKKGNNRLFSEEDELTILKGLADFISVTKKDPLKDGTAFHSFVKKSLSAQLSNQQLKRKVRDLKKKYETSDSFTKAHDRKAFELFKKVWGNDGANKAEESVKVESDADMSLILPELFRFDASGLSALSNNLMKRGLELMEESKRVEFEEKLRQLEIAEVELFQKRSEVFADCSNSILQAINKSSK